MVGSHPQTDSRLLIFLLGGDKSTVDKASKLLSALSSVIHHIVSRDLAIQMKLAVNALFRVQVSGLGGLLA